MRYKIERTEPTEHKFYIIEIENRDQEELNKLSEFLFDELELNDEHEDEIISVMRDSDAISLDIDRSFFFICEGKVSRGIIAHETYHLINMMFERIGHKPNVDNNELEAYSFQRMFERIERFLYED
jgi:hypothetical protein